MDDYTQYGFLGPMIGIAGIVISAGSAMLFGWTRTLDTWKPPPEVLPTPLNRVVTLLCSIGIVLAWLFAEPANRPYYVRWMLRLAAITAVGLLAYVGLLSY